MSTSRSNSPKRTRVNEEALVEAAAGKSDSKSPLQTAIGFIEERSVASLHEHAAQMVAGQAKEVVKLLAKCHHKRSQIKKLEEDVELIPKSARIKFEFSVSKDCEANEEFMKIKNETKEEMDKAHKYLKKQVIATIKIEGKIAREKALTQHCMAAYATVQALLISDRKEITDAHQIVSSIYNKHTERLLTNFRNMNFVKFKEAYKKAHGLSTMPDPKSIADVQATALRQSQQEDSDDTVSEAEAELATQGTVQQHDTKYDYGRYTNVLETFFKIPWNMYMHQTTLNATELQLKRLHMEQTTAKKTDQVAMEIELETPADRQQLQELIQLETAKATKAMQKEISQMSATIKKLNSGNKNNAMSNDSSKKSKGRGQSPSASNIKNQAGRGRGTNRARGRGRVTARSTAARSQPFAQAITPPSGRGRGRGRQGERSSGTSTGRERSARPPSNNRSGGRTPRTRTV